MQTRALENGRAHLAFATARLQAGAGSRLNELRAAQETSTDEVLLEAALLLPAAGAAGARRPPRRRRPGRRRGRAHVRAARRAAVDVAVGPRRRPAGRRRGRGRRTRPARQLEGLGADRHRQHSSRSTSPRPGSPSRRAPGRRSSQFGIPIFDGGQRRAAARQRDVALELARIDRVDLEREIRADERIAREAVVSTARALAAARRAADQANEVVRITDVAFRAGATTNLEVIDAQRRARDAETAAAIAEDRGASGPARPAGRARAVPALNGHPHGGARRADPDRGERAAGGRPPSGAPGRARQPGARVLRPGVGGGAVAAGQGRPPRRALLGRQHPARGRRRAARPVHRRRRRGRVGDTGRDGRHDDAPRSVRRAGCGPRRDRALVRGQRPAPRRAVLGDLRPLAARVGHQPRGDLARTSTTCSPTARAPRRRPPSDRARRGPASGRRRSAGTSRRTGARRSAARRGSGSARAGRR